MFFMGIKAVKSKFKIKHVIFGLILSYIIMCQSCMTMCTSTKKTAIFFKELKTPYLDKTVKVDNHQLHFIQTGQENKPTLVFIHGSPGSWDAFKKYMVDTLLLQKYRMIAIDRPGFGYSDFGNAENLKTQSQLITDFLKTVDNKQPIVLVGHSMGGPVIVKMETEQPNVYRHLVILSGSVDPDAEETENWRYFIKMKPLRYLIPGAMRPANDELWWLKQDLIELKPFLKNVICDVTIIHGTKDRLVPYSNVAFMEKQFINAKSVDVISIKNADHFIPWTHFEIIRKALLDLKF